MFLVNPVDLIFLLNDIYYITLVRMLLGNSINRLLVFDILVRVLVEWK